MLTKTTGSVDCKLVEHRRRGGQAHPFSSDGAIRPKLQSPLAARCQSVIMFLWRQLNCVALHCSALPVCRTCVRGGGSGNRGTLVHTTSCTKLKLNIHTAPYKLCTSCAQSTTLQREPWCTQCTVHYNLHTLTTKLHINSVCFIPDHSAICILQSKGCAKQGKE